MSKEAMKLALDAFSVIEISDNLDWIRHQAEQQAAALREALEEPDFWEGYVPEPDKRQQALDKMAENARELGLDYEPDGMHHNKPQKRPQNCGTSYCSCIECVMEPAQQEPVAKDNSNYRLDQPGLDPLYTPPQRTWVGLSDEDISARAANFYNPEMYKRAALWAQEKLKERNQ